MEIRQNLLDKAIGYFSPATARRRLYSRAMLNLSNSYLGGRTDRRPTKLWLTSSGDADSDIIYQLDTLRQRSRDSIRNNPIAVGAINIVTGNVAGRGLKLQARIKRNVIDMTDEQADAWESKVEAEFGMWAESQNCDISRTTNFYESQELILRQVLENGDVFVLLPRSDKFAKPYSLKIQIVEADRICNKDNAPDTKTLKAGIEKDSAGAPIAYHIMRDHPGGISPNRTWDIFPAYDEKTGLKNVIHIYKLLRPGQTRGVPWLAPVLEPLRQLEQYTQSELTSAVISSMLTVFIKTDSGNLDFDITPSNAESTASHADNELRLGSGAIIALAQGEDISVFDPKRPNQGFDAFFIAILRQIGTALEIPFEVLIKHFTASYSASRSALMEAWRFFRIRRDWLARHYCQQIYKAWLYEAIALGRVSAPGYFTDPLIRWAYSSATWIGDAPIQIDPIKEIGAARERIATGLSTVDEETAFITGGDFENNYPRIKKEVEMYRAIGIKHPAVQEKEEVEDEVLANNK